MAISISSANLAYNNAKTLGNSNQASDLHTNFNQALKQASMAYSGISPNGITSSSQASLISSISESTFNKIRNSELISTNSVINNASTADVVTAISEAEIALQSLVTIRDKVLAAYNDIIKMQI